MSSAEPLWVPRLVIEAVHFEQIREHGGLYGIRDENALESALARAKQRWSYQADVDLHELAADYTFGIARNHPFVDGNKRIAFLAAYVFLGLNGQILQAGEDDVVRIIVALASGSLDRDSLADWLRLNTVAR